MPRRLDHVRTAWKESPLLLVALIVMILSSLLPIWIGRYVPLLDYPAHLGNLFVWRHLDDPSLGFARYYERNFAPLPYWVQYGIEYGLATIFGEERAQKLFLSLAILGLPAAVALYARQLGRDPWLAVLACPLSWNMNVANGFLAYVGGLPILFVALWALDRYAAAPSWRRAALSLGLGILVYFSHVLLWGALLCIGGMTALWSVRKASLRAFLVAPLPLVPTLLLGIWAQRYSDADKTRLTVAGKGLSDFVGVFSDVWQNLQTLRGWTLNTMPGVRDDLYYQAALLGLWMALLFMGFRQETPSTAAQDPPSLVRRIVGRAELGFVLVSVLYFSLPRSLLKPFYWYAVNRRLAVLVALFALLLVRGPVSASPLRRAMLLLGMGLSILYTTDLSAHHFRINRRIAAYEELIALVPRGKQVLPLMTQFGDPDCAVNCFNQWGSYLQIRQGGYMIPFFPVEFPLRRRQVQTPTPIAWDHPQSFRFAEHGRGWDYFLIHGPVLPTLFAGSEDAVVQLGQRGDWTLYQKKPGLP